MHVFAPRTFIRLFIPAHICPGKKARRISRARWRRYTSAQFRDNGVIASPAPPTSFYGASPFTGRDNSEAPPRREKGAFLIFAPVFRARAVPIFREKSWSNRPGTWITIVDNSATASCFIVRRVPRASNNGDTDKWKRGIFFFHRGLQWEMIFVSGCCRYLFFVWVSGFWEEKGFLVSFGLGNRIIIIL